MPGLFGYFGSQNDKSLLDQMGKALISNDSQLVSLNKNEGEMFGIGLASLGLFSKNGEEAYDENSGWLVQLHGELTNKSEILSMIKSEKLLSDAQLVLRLYLRQGEKSFSLLKGAFALSCINNIEKKLYLVSDPHGLKPIFYRHYNGVLYFASRIIALRPINVPRRLDWVALSQLTAYGYILDERTLVDGIKKLPPATILYFDSKNLSLTSYRKWEKSSYTGKPLKFHLNRLYDTFLASAENNLTSEFRYGLPLTGGLDSRAILAVADYLKRKNKLPPLMLYTFALNPKCTDYVIAKELAKIAGLPYRLLKLSEDSITKWGDHVVQMTDGVFNIIDAHSIEYVYDYNKWFDIVLFGVGGEFARAHYADLAWHLSDDHLDYLENKKHLTDFCLKKFNVTFDIEKEFPFLFSAEKVNSLQESSRDAMSRTMSTFPQDASSRDILDLFYLQKRAVNFQQGGRGHDEVSTETRYIYMDDDYLQAVYDAPFSLKRGGGIQRCLIEQFSPKMGRVKRDRTGLPMNMGKTEEKCRLTLEKLLEKSRIKRPYRVIPYVNYAVLLRGPLKDYFASILFSKRLKDRGIFQESFIDRIWSQHMDGQSWKYEEIALLATIELFCRWYLD